MFNLQTANFPLKKLFKLIEPDMTYSHSHPSFPDCDEYAPYSSQTYAFVLSKTDYSCEPCELFNGLITNHSNMVFMLKPEHQKHFPSFPHFETFVYYIQPLIQQNISAGIFSVSNIVLFFIPIINSTFDFNRMINNNEMNETNESVDETSDEEPAHPEEEEWIF